MNFIKIGANCTCFMTRTVSVCPSPHPKSLPKWHFWPCQEETVIWCIYGGFAIRYLIKMQTLAIKFNFFSPVGLANQSMLQPLRTVPPSVLKSRCTTLLLLVMAGGKKVPHLFSIKVVPSPSLTFKLSQLHLSQLSWSLFSSVKAVNSNLNTSPCSTWIVSVFLRLLG